MQKRAVAASGLAAAALLLPLTGVALAQDATYPPELGGGGGTLTTPFEAPPVAESPRTLPFTGQDLATAAALGAGALAVGGAVLVAVRRRRAPGEA